MFVMFLDVEPTPQYSQDLIKLLEDLLKSRDAAPQPPVINVNVPEQSPRYRDTSMLSDRYLRPSSPIRTSTPARV